MTLKNFRFDCFYSLFVQLVVAIGVRRRGTGQNAAVSEQGGGRCISIFGVVRQRPFHRRIVIISIWEFILDFHAFVNRTETGAKQICCLYKHSADKICGEFAVLFFHRGWIKALSYLRCANLAPYNIIFCETVEHIPRDIFLGKIDLIVLLSGRNAHLICI